MKAILRWHVFVYLCTILGCFGYVFHVGPSNGDSQDEDDSFIIAYLQANGISIGLSPKE